MNKDKLTLLRNIEVTLENGVAYSFNQLSEILGSQRITIKACCEYLVEKDIIEKIEIKSKDKDGYLVRKKDVKK